MAKVKEKQKREFKYVATGKFHIPMAAVDDENRPISRVITTGDKVLSHRDLTSLWPGKFVEVTKEIATQDAGPILDLTDRAALASPDDVKTGAGKQEEARNEQKAQETSSNLGDDVTEDFENAASGGYKVFRDVKDFYVVKEDDINTPLNTKPLRRAKVERFISNLSEETSDDSEE